MTGNRLALRLIIVLGLVAGWAVGLHAPQTTAAPVPAAPLKGVLARR